MRKQKSIASVAAMAMMLACCAGRTPNPVQTVQATDHDLSCTQIQAEIKANNDQIISLSGEEGEKLTQNMAIGAAGIFVSPLWFALDVQDAAGKEGEALQSRNEYLAHLYAINGCASAPRPVDAVRPEETQPTSTIVQPQPTTTATQTPPSTLSTTKVQGFSPSAPSTVR